MSILALQLQQFKIENLFFMEAVKNVIMKNGDFVKFLYSDEDCVMNSLYFEVPIIFTGIEKSFHKNKLVYDPYNSTNISIIRELYSVEKAILDYYEHASKKTIYKISESVFHGNIHFVGGGGATVGGDDAAGAPPAAGTRLILKFSGIWENANEYGITYKFILL
jgi:hypothetical protein